MSSSEQSAPTFPNPYVGPRSIQNGEALYGRDRELRDLVGLLIAERIVLLHSPSGAGKTSLIQAALIPELRERDFNVLPVLRVSLEPPVAHAAAKNNGTIASDALAGAMNARDSNGGDLASSNRYTLSLLLSLEEALPAAQQLPLGELAALTLAEYLDRDVNRTNRDDVLIFDQFEEILTVDPFNQAAKAAFFVQLGAALRDRHRWALFAMRDDYAAALEPYLKPVPTRLSTTFRLDLLGVAAAHQALEQPAAAANVRFQRAAAGQLIDDLRRVQVQQADGSTVEQLGAYVEPVQLQVVCYRLWQQISAGRQFAGNQAITTGDVATVGDVGQALADYYAERVAQAATQSGVAERSVREWFDRQLITPQAFVARSCARQATACRPVAPPGRC